MRLQCRQIGIIAVADSDLRRIIIFCIFGRDCGRVVVIVRHDGNIECEELRNLKKAVKGKRVYRDYFNAIGWRERRTLTLRHPVMLP